jgi:predicted exporter
LWARDPTGEMLVVAESLIPARAPRLRDGVWVSPDDRRALMLLTLAAGAQDIDAQAGAVHAVRAAFDAHREGANPRTSATPIGTPTDGGLTKPVDPSLTLTLTVTGPGVFAMQSRELIQREAERLSLWGTLGVVLVLWLAFARVSAIALAALPVATGVVAGIAATSLSFGQVHGMTLGFGAALIGESVDYAIYYLIQARPSGPSTNPSHDSSADMRSRWWHDGWPTVRLGLLTSVCGFAALVFSGFPGLAQLGVFSLAGLIAAALATRYVLPVLAPHGAPGVGLRARLGQWTARALAWLPRLRIPALALTVVALGWLALAPHPLWRGDLQSLSPVPKAAIDSDLELRAALGASDARTVVVARGATAQAALEAAEAASVPLLSLVERGVIVGFDTPTRLVPSERTQKRRLASLPERAALQSTLDAAVQGLPFRAPRVAEFIDDVQNARTRAAVGVDTWRGTALAPLLDGMLFTLSDGGHAALLPLHFDDDAPLAMQESRALEVKQTLAAVPSITVLDIKQTLDRLYARYLREALWQSALGALAVVALLAWALRDAARLARVVLPLAMALAWTLALLAALNVPLGILHLIGLLLVIAVGSNYALFFDQLQAGPLSSPPGSASTSSPPSRQDAPDADTLASLLLANITTVLTFALMATSGIAALSAIGMVVAPGALLALLLSAVTMGRWDNSRR